ncbi:MAG: DUF7714 family protein [Egibacteraceae bacterium]
MNTIPGREREVSSVEIDVPLTIAALRRALVGREAYRRTRFLIVRRDDALALVELRKESDDALFSPITDVQLLAGPDDCVLVTDPEVDTAVPSQLAAAAASAPGARCVVVEGRYEHLGFILDPAPLRIRVVDVGPPHPPKLLDQLRRVLDIAEELPPVALVPDLLDVHQLAAAEEAPSLLFPCQASDLAVDGRRVAYLDRRPPREEWLLIGCARSRQIHRWFYGDDPPMVDTCPLTRAANGDAPTIVRCCLEEEGLRHVGATVVIPWGASLEEVRQGLALAVGQAGAAK